MMGRFLLLLAIFTIVRAGPLPPYNLKCEGNHVGLSKERLQELNRHHLFATDSPTPTFTWTIAHSEREARQLAFQVLVADRSDFLIITWDSGKVFSQDITSIKYTGPMHTSKLLFWKVLWWDHDGKMATSEETGHFVSGIISQEDWAKAKWITAGSNIQTAPLLYNSFKVNSSMIKQASIFMSGLGYSNLFVNGTDIHARYDPPIALSPGWSNYEKLIPFVHYDVTTEAKKSDTLNVGVMLGRGWRNTQDYPLEDPGGIPSSDSTERVLRFIMYIFYDSGTNVTFVSDESWLVDETPITSDSIYDGEVYEEGTLQDDSHKVIIGANVTVVNVTGPSGNMYMAEMPYIAEVRIEQAVKIYNHLDSQGHLISQIADFGYNSAGYCQLKNDDESEYSIHHAEVPMHLPYGQMDGSLFYSNLRGAKAMDSYSGKTETTHKPSFTYHGFRYAEVTGFERKSLTVDDIQKIVIHSNVTNSSKFNSSIPLLNNIQDNCIRAQLSNLMSVVTDCDQRDERLGWMGDAALSAYSMQLNFDMQALHKNFLDLMTAEMIDGTLPDVVPFVRYGSRPSDPSWGAAFPEILYRIATYYKNIEVARTFYPAVMHYITAAIPPQGITKIAARYGDWVPPPPNQKVPVEFSGAFSFLSSVTQVKEIANLLGMSEDVQELQLMYDTFTDEFNKGFMQGNVYLNGLQATYVMPLALGAVPSDMKDDFVKAFLNQLQDPKGDNSHITGGIITTRYLFPVLSQLKQDELALHIAQQVDYPSYGFMIHNTLEPATAIWELWNAHNGSSSMDSRNHHMYSSISGWMMTDLPGLELKNDSMDEIHFHPARSLGLSHISVSLEHPKPVRFSWKRSGGIQCAKQAENQSPLNPNLPKKNDLVLSCGDEDGGKIVKILFASYGNPTGYCGGYHKVGSCHVPNSLTTVEKLCLGEKSCAVPTGADFWGNPCPNEVKWLSVAVQCQSEFEEFIYSSIKVNVSVPMGSRGFLHFPAYGKSKMSLWDGDEMVFSEAAGFKPTSGIKSTKWEMNSDSLMVELASGRYNLIWRGSSPTQLSFVDSRSFEGQSTGVVLQCGNGTGVITSINWASYGTPFANISRKNTGTHTHELVLGDCHAGSSKFTLERECIGKSKCVVQPNENYFGKVSCLESGKKGHLIGEYTCNPRWLSHD